MRDGEDHIDGVTSSLIAVIVSLVRMVVKWSKRVDLASVKCLRDVSNMLLNSGFSR